MGKILLRWGLFALLLGVPALAHAQTVSRHYPNDQNCTGANTCNVALGTPAGKSMDAKAGGKDASNIPYTLNTNPTYSVPLVAGQTGPAVAANELNQMCLAAFGPPASGLTILNGAGLLQSNKNGNICTGPTGACPLGGAPCGCCDAAPGDSIDLFVRSSPGLSPALRVTRNPGADSYTVANFGGSALNKFTHTSNGGNTNGPDLLAQYRVQLNPSGVDGIVVFKAFHSQGGTNPRTFSVNTAGLTANALCSAIFNGFNNMGLGFNVTADITDLNLFTGYFVVLTNASAKATEFDVDALPGQVVTDETRDPPPPPAPALNPWGTTILVGLMILTSLWFLRARRRTQQL